MRMLAGDNLLGGLTRVIEPRQISHGHTRFIDLRKGFQQYGQIAQTSRLRTLESYDSTRVTCDRCRYPASRRGTRRGSWSRDLLKKGLRLMAESACSNSGI